MLKVLVEVEGGCVTDTTVFDDARDVLKHELIILDHDNGDFVCDEADCSHGIVRQDGDGDWECDVCGTEYLSTCCGSMSREDFDEHCEECEICRKENIG